jgi:PAS domain S-box-containing protein
MNRWLEFLKVVFVAIAYAFFAKLSLTNFSIHNGNVSLIWPSSGIALAAMILGGKRYYLSVFLGSFAADFLSGTPAIPSLFIAIGNTLEPLLGFWLILNSKTFNNKLQLPKDFIKIIFAGSLSACLCAFIGVSTLWLSGSIQQSAIKPALLNWWQGDMLGIALITPFILVWQDWPRKFIDREHLVETLTCFGFLIIFGQVVFLNLFHEYLGFFARGYIIFLFISWSAVRFGIHGVTLTVVITSILALLGSKNGTGIFANDYYHTHLFNLWFYLLVMTLVGMALSFFASIRKKVEDDLMESNELMNDILDSMNAHVVVLDINGVIIRTNEAWRNFALKNSTVGEISVRRTGVGVNYLDICQSSIGEWADGALIVKEGIVSVLEGQLEIFTHEYPCHSPNEHRWFRVSVTPLKSNIGGAVVTHTNITEQKLSEVEMRIAAIAFDAQEGMFITDGNGIIIKVNNAFTKITGYTLNEVIGYYPKLLSSKRHDDSFYKAMWGSINFSGFWQGEIWDRRKNGDEFPAYVTITSVFNNEGLVINYVCTLTDATNFKANEQKRIANEVTLRETLVREVNHRIKNNLQGVTGILHNFALRHPELAVPITEVISQVDSIAVIHGLQGRDLPKVRLCEMIKEIASNSAILWHIAVEVEIPNYWTKCQIAESETVPIALILNELITNAIKHSDFEKSVKIKLEYESLRNVVIVTIYNFGQLPSDFYLTNAKVAGTGMMLVGLLLHEEGAKLTWEQCDNMVEARLELQFPAVLFNGEEFKCYDES